MLRKGRLPEKVLEPPGNWVWRHRTASRAPFPFCPLEVAHRGAQQGTHPLMFCSVPSVLTLYCSGQFPHRTTIFYFFLAEFLVMSNRTHAGWFKQERDLFRNIGSLEFPRELANEASWHKTGETLKLLPERPTRIAASYRQHRGCHPFSALLSNLQQTVGSEWHLIPLGFEFKSRPCMYDWWGVYVRHLDPKHTC